MEQQETKRKRIAFATSLGVHLVILLLFLFLMAWRAPDPPLPEFGIELNFGNSDEGSGEIQPETPTATEQQVEDQTPQEEVPTEPEETQPEVIQSTQESVVPEERKEEKPKETPKPEEKKEEVKTTVPATENKGAQPQSQGDDTNKAGDKGDPKGVPDPNAAYTGKPGGGGGGDGMQLSMAGWEWADNPKTPNIPDNEDGRIVFEIECDEDGEIVGIKTLERGLSLQAEQMLLQEIRRNSLIRVGDGQIPPRSKGKVVFNLKTK